MKTAEQLVKEAEAVQPVLKAGHYREAMLVLRNRGLTYRQIQRWFAERGVALSYQKVYRAVKRE